MNQQKQVIEFYGRQCEHGCFSNFAYSPIRVDGRVWSTVEHYYQAQKFAGSEHEHTIRAARSPGMAKRLGRSKKFRLRHDWESVKDAVMRRGVLAKFTQHPTLREFLLGTGDAVLVEHTSSDDYWGDGGDGHGKNKLGRILMSVREELRVTQEN